MIQIADMLAQLRAEQARLTAAIAALEVLARADAQAAPVMAPVPTRQPKTAKRAKPAQPPAPVVKPDTLKPGSPSARVRADLAKHGPSTTAALVTSTKLDAKQVLNALQRLRLAGLVSCSGARGSYVWSLVNPINGRPSGSTVAYETVWNGTKERNGDAPGLSSHTQR